MNIVYCRLETVDNNTRDFNFESITKLKKEDYDLVYRSYLYMIYYFATTSEMSDRDLEFYDLYSPPFIKAVFIFKFEEQFFKLSYIDTPLSYQLSNFFPETGESTIISSQSREIYNTMIKDFKIDKWSDYKLLFDFIPSGFDSEEKEEDEEENSLSLVSAYGDDYTVDNKEENSLSLGSSSVQYEEVSEGSVKSEAEFEKYSIDERRTLLEKYKKDLKDALEIKEIKGNLNEINKKLKYYSGIKKEIENFNIIIEKKEEERSSFNDIHWMSKNLYNQMNTYINKKKKYEGDLIAYQEKLDKNKKDIDSIIPDNILKNKVFMMTFLVALITFILSWVMREQFWYLSGASILFFTISFYYFWGYIDYIDYIIKLKREKNFYEKKIVKSEANFKKEFSNLEIILKKENVDDLNIPINRYEELKEFDTSLEAMKEKVQTFIAQKFSEDTQIKFEELIKEKSNLLETLKSFSTLELNAKEIEFDIIELKKSIKNFEKQELDEFSLDDELEEENLSIEEEKTIDLSQSQENLEHKYELNKLKDYFSELKNYFTEDISNIYEELKKDFLDIIDFSIHHQFYININFSEDEFTLLSDTEIDWNKNNQNKFKFFLQYSLIKHLLSKKSFPVFVDLSKISEDYNIMFSSYLEELSDGQIVYSE